MSVTTGNHLTISSGNTKLGKIPNLSLPPGLSCRPDAPCKIDCYANKAYRMYPSVRNAWGGNLKFYNEDPEGFFAEIHDWMAVNSPTRFRIHVSGDCPDERYFREWCSVAVVNPDTSLLIFTKKYDLPFYLAPNNLKIVLSMWPGLDLPEGLDHMPKAWLTDDLRFPVLEPYIFCPGKCDQCGSCWDAVSPVLPVVFNRH